MLVLARKSGERIMIGDGIALTIVGMDRRSVRLAIDAPRSVTVLREELARRSDPRDRRDSRAEVVAATPA